MPCTYWIQSRHLQVNYSRKYNTGMFLPVHSKFYVLITDKVACFGHQNVFENYTAYEHAYTESAQHTRN
jgi:hypothetical protein